MLPNDLKHLNDAEDSFALFTPEEAGGLLALLVVGLVLFDLLRRLFQWMTAL